MMQTGNTVTPWYKQFWPWVLIGLPTSVVIASVVTYFLAINGMDSVISKDYYKEGLAVNADLERDKKPSLWAYQRTLPLTDKTSP